MDGIKARPPRSQLMLFALIKMLYASFRTTWRSITDHWDKKRHQSSFDWSWPMTVSSCGLTSTHILWRQLISQMEKSKGALTYQLLTYVCSSPQFDTMLRSSGLLRSKLNINHPIVRYLVTYLCGVGSATFGPNNGEVSGYVSWYDTCIVVVSYCRAVYSLGINGVLRRSVLVS